jgi:hypothetical protein
MNDMPPQEERRARPTPVGARKHERPKVRLPDPDDTTGLPEAPVREHELWVEREPWAKYVGSLAGLRIAAAVAVRAKRKAAGEWVPPHPWFPALVTTGLLAGAVGAIWFVVWLVQRFGQATP